MPLELLAGDRAEVDLIGAVGDAQSAGPDVDSPDVGARDEGDLGGDWVLVSGKPALCSCGSSDARRRYRDTM
jgi:hypothetical protein